MGFGSWVVVIGPRAEPSCGVGVMAGMVDAGPVWRNEGGAEVYCGGGSASASA